LIDSILFWNFFGYKIFQIQFNIVIAGELEAVMRTE